MNIIEAIKAIQAGNRVSQPHSVNIQYGDCPDWGISLAVFFGRPLSGESNSPKYIRGVEEWRINKIDVLADDYAIVPKEQWFQNRGW